MQASYLHAWFRDQHGVMGSTFSITTQVLSNILFGSGSTCRCGVELQYAEPQQDSFFSYSWWGQA
jgi:hypothetical protein